MGMFLVTGGCGFIGSHLVDALLRAGDCVLDVDSLDPGAGHLPEGGDEQTSLRPAPGAAQAAEHGGSYELVRADLAADGAEARLCGLMRRHRATHVMHLAAKTHVDQSFDAALATGFTRANVVGTHRLLEAARGYAAETGQLRLFLHMSTDEVYGETAPADAEEGAKEDETVLRPTNPYAASKAGAELLVRSYQVCHGLPCLVVRCNNVYGPRQQHDKVLPRFFRLARAGLPLTLHGDGSMLRCFVHVRDTVEALLLLLRRGEVGEVYNVGSGHEVSVSELARMVLGLASLPPDHVVYVQDRPFNDKRYFVRDEKLRTLGWWPKQDFASGLAAVFASEEVQR